MTDPKQPVFLSYNDLDRNNVDGLSLDELRATGAYLAPELIKFVPKADSPNGKDLIMAGFEVSNHFVIYEVETCGWKEAPPALPPKVKISFVHINDMHARVEPANAGASNCKAEDIAAGTCFGGLARVATAVDAARAESDITLFLDAGDVSVGTIWGSVFRNNTPTAVIQNTIGLDAMVR